MARATATGAETDAVLFGAEPGDAHKQECAEIYAAYVSTADTVADRRQRASTFGLTANTGLVSLIAYLEHAGVTLTPLLAVAGFVFSWTWYRQITAYQLVNRVKFDVIQAMEARLPLRPFQAEWRDMGHGEDPQRYRSRGRLEAVVPRVFMALHVVVFGAALLL